MTGNDQAAGARPTRRLLTSLRDVLFENTTAVAPQVSPNPPSSGAPAASDVDAARAVLRAAIEAQLGPGIREFSLQNEALSEVLPDLATRRSAALRVLALKGTTRDHLCVELANALGTLTAQGDAFARKLRERRAALAQSEQGEEQGCREELKLAEETIARLRAELDAQQALITAVQARRDQQRARNEADLGELGLRERAFQCAFQEVEGEYLALRAQLSRESS